MSTQPIAIIGAGLAGLTLGRCLSHKGIPAVIYERVVSQRFHNHAITLNLSTYQPLLSILRIDDPVFRSKVTVDFSTNSRGKPFVHQVSPQTSPDAQTDSFRCDQGRLERFLALGQSIKYDSQVENVEIESESSKITATFRSGKQVESSCLIGCDGPHSKVRWTFASPPKLRVQVLPYVVFRCSRIFSWPEYHEILDQYLQNSSLIQTRKGDILLEISIQRQSAYGCSISCTFSRPARDGHDPLYKPRRKVAEADIIPEEFYEELDQLRGLLNAPFAEVYESSNFRKGTVINWLMRRMMPEANEVQNLADKGVILIGDAGHPLPILGGEGANMAIKDGIELAEHIATEGIAQGIKSFVSPSRCLMWQQAVLDSEKWLEEMHHSPATSNL